MPNKRVDNLKKGWERKTAQAWQEHFGVENMTTRELRSIEARHEFDKNPEEVRNRIEKERRRK